MSEIDRISDVLRQHVGRVRVPAAWDNFVARLPDADDCGVADGGIDVEIIGAQYVIDYVNAKGEPSHRRIEVRRVDVRSADALILAFCHERRALRAFLASRILEAYNAVTGEVMVDPVAYFCGLAKGSPTLEAIAKSAPGVQLLLCFAVCDGRFADEEVGVILRYMEWFTDSPGDVDWRLAERFVRAAWPDLARFDKAVARLRREPPEEITRLLRWARKLVHADGQLGKEEVSLIEILAEKAGRPDMCV